ncbi:MAG: phosphoglucosamine mutase [Planctomycetota bacterium]
MSDGSTDSKPEAPLMIGVSGLRGIVGESLTPEVAMQFAGTFGTWLGELAGDEPPYVLVGRDGRAGGESTYTAVISALLATGCRVNRVGVAMTPTIGFLADAKRAHAAVVITASHNPAEWNGIKLLLRDPAKAGDTDGRIDVEGCTIDAAAPHADLAAQIISRYQAGSITYASQHAQQDSTVEDDEIQPHCLRVKMRLEELLDVDDWGAFVAEQVSTVVIDAVNASGVAIDHAFFDDEPIRLMALADSTSGIFPHTPEPTAENLSGEGGLCDAVPGLKADVGFAQDPDGDRLAIVDETGRYIGEEYTLALCAVSILEAHQSRGREHAGTESENIVLCANLSTSRMIDDIAARYDASVVRTAVGEANVVEAMKRLKREGKAVLLGGEGNGGVIWPEVTYVRDSLGSMALVLSLMARTGKTVSELVADIPSYAIVKRKQPLAKKEDAKPAIERIAAHYASERVDTQDGVRVDFDSKKAWVHVRASNTEPILRLIAEAEDEATANEILDEVAKLVER